MSSFYGKDLAHIQTIGHGAMAAAVAPQIMTMLHSRGMRTGTLGDVGCGAGVAASHFLGAGWKVWALEQSPWLLATARTTAPAARFLPHRTPYGVAIPHADAIVAIGEVLNYHRPGDDAHERVNRFFATAATSLPPGGLLIFDVIVKGAALLAGRTWTAGQEWAILQEIHEDRRAGTLRREIETFRRIDDTYRRGHETHHVRVFDANVLARALRRAGFTVETAVTYGTFRLAPRRRAFCCERRDSGPRHSTRTRPSRRRPGGR
jgi:hypothetical protein